MRHSIHMRAVLNFAQYHFERSRIGTMSFLDRSLLSTKVFMTKQARKILAGMLGRILDIQSTVG